MNGRLGTGTLALMVATTPTQWATGLMKRRKIASNAGMLFIYPTSLPRTFWMKNTSIPLDVAFLDGNGKVMEIRHLAPQSTDPVTSKRPAKYALEVNCGWFAQNRVKVGSILTIWE